MKPQTAQLSLQVAGRLSHFLHNWEVLTTDKWVIETVKGFQIHFVGHPVQGCRQSAPIYSLELHLLIQEEVKALLGKGAVQVCNPVPQESFYSTLFLVAKKGGQMRPVINLKRINEWITPQHFKMEGMSTLRELLKTNDWMAKIDLKDAYFTILMHPTHQPFLRFMANQQHFLIYQFTCLPFGLSCAPWVFTKVMKPISIFLRSMGVGMIVYIDDILVMGESPEQVKGHLEALTHLLTGLGFVINVPKSITTPAQRIEYLGLLVDSTTLHLSLPGEKLHHIRSEIDQITKKSSPMTARQLAQIIGKLHTASQAILPAPLFYRSLQGDLQIALNSSSQNYNSLLTLSQPAQEELAWWQDKLSHWNAKALLHRTETVTIRSDVSIQGGEQYAMVPGQGDPGVMQSRRCTYIKLPGAVSSYISSESILKGSEGSVSEVTAGQSDNCSIQQQYGGNSFPAADKSLQTPVDVGTIQRH